MAGGGDKLGRLEGQIDGEGSPLSGPGAQIEPVDSVGPLAQNFYPAEDDDRPELFLPEEGDSDPSNFEPVDGDSNPDNYERPDLDELALPARSTGGVRA